MLDSTKMLIELLGRFGYHAKYIQSKIKKYDGEEYSLATIYKTLKDSGVKLRDYRDGKGQYAKLVTGAVIGKVHPKQKRVYSPITKYLPARIIS